MNNQNDWGKVKLMIKKYIEMIHEELSVRWQQWDKDLSKSEMYEVIGALLARQVTLATQLAQAPAIWNGHIAPIILRSMVDNYITLAWILKDPEERSQKFISYGLGQEKLQIEHRKARLKGKDNKEDPLIQIKEDWLNTQHYSFLTEVNIGSWSGLATRQMAEQADCIDFYNLTYIPFSAATHNMWNHVERYNLTRCPNPLHRFHRIPIDLPIEIADVDYVYRAAKYVDKVFRLFDEFSQIRSRAVSAIKYLVCELEKIDQSDSSSIEKEQ